MNNILVDSGLELMIESGLNEIELMKNNYVKKVIEYIEIFEKKLDHAHSKKNQANNEHEKLKEMLLHEKLKLETISKYGDMKDDDDAAYVAILASKVKSIESELEKTSIREASAKMEEDSLRKVLRDLKLNFYEQFYVREEDEKPVVSVDFNDDRVQQYGDLIDLTADDTSSVAKVTDDGTTFDDNGGIFFDNNDGVQYHCSIKLEKDIDDAIEKSKQFLEETRSMCKTLSKLWRYVQSQLDKLKKRKKDAIIIIARNDKDAIVGLELGILEGDGRRTYGRSLFTIVHPLYRNRKYGKYIVKMYEDALARKVAEKRSKCDSKNSVTAIVNVFGSKKFFSQQGYNSLEGENVCSKELSLPSSSSSSSSLPSSSIETTETDNDPLYRPSSDEIESLFRDKNIVCTLVQKYGWHLETIFQGAVNALIPPYLGRKLGDLNSRTILENNYFTEGEHFFKVDKEVANVVDEKAIKLHLNRYGYGNFFRPMNAAEMRKHLSKFGWKFINRPHAIDDCLDVETIWIRGGVETLVTGKRNIDYFASIEDIADYFVAAKASNAKIEIQSERVSILPVVVGYGEWRNKGEISAELPSSSSSSRVLNDITNIGTSKTHKILQNKAVSKKRTPQESSSEFNKKQKEHPRPPLEYFTDV